MFYPGSGHLGPLGVQKWFWFPFHKTLNSNCSWNNLFIYIFFIIGTALDPVNNHMKWFFYSHMNCWVSNWVKRACGVHLWIIFKQYSKMKVLLLKWLKCEDFIRVALSEYDFFLNGRLCIRNRFISLSFPPSPLPPDPERVKWNGEFPK